MSKWKLKIEKLLIRFTLIGLIAKVVRYSYNLTLETKV